MFECEGVVKRFSNAKGYGFIARDDGGADVFVHYSAIRTETHKSLKKGAAVRVSVIQDEKGSRAEWVYALARQNSAGRSGSPDWQRSHARVDPSAAKTENRG
jgi:CspA family cold shock protein